MKEKDYLKASKAASLIAAAAPVLKPTDHLKVPQWLFCGDCEYVWIGIFLPMEMAKYARLLRRAFCPKCGATAGKIRFAKQQTGALLEPSPHQSVFDGPVLEGIRARALKSRGRKTAPISDFNWLWSIVEFCIHNHPTDLSNSLEKGKTK